SGDVLSARPASAVLRPAVHQRLEMNSPPNEKRTDSLWRSELVSRDGEEIELLRLRVDWDFAKSLDGVGMEQRAALLCLVGELGHRLNRTDLVIDPHHRADCDIVLHRFVKGRAIDHSLRGHRQ